MEQFYNSWLKVINNLKSPDSVSDEAREELFLKACEQLLKNDVDHLRGSPLGIRQDLRLLDPEHEISDRSR